MKLKKREWSVKYFWVQHEMSFFLPDEVCLVIFSKNIPSKKHTKLRANPWQLFIKSVSPLENDFIDTDLFST